MLGNHSSAPPLVGQLGGDGHHHTRLLNHVQVVSRHIDEPPTTTNTQIVHLGGKEVWHCKITQLM